MSNSIHHVIVDRFCFASFHLDSLANIEDMKVIGTLSLALGMATDFVIALALCYFLRRLRTGYRKYVPLLNRFPLPRSEHGLWQR